MIVVTKNSLSYKDRSKGEIIRLVLVILHEQYEEMNLRI